MKKAILLVAYGAQNHQAKSCLMNFELKCRALFPGIPLRWAYSSSLLRDRIARQKRKSDSIKKALFRLFYEKYEAIAIQPLQAIAGREYDDVLHTANQAGQELPLKLKIGAPLLSRPEDLDPVACALYGDLPQERAKNEDVILMGHGARHPAGHFYDDLARIFLQKDPHVFVATMSGANSLEALLPRLTSSKVWLMPLLANIGNHALKDMAGSSPLSWKSRIEAFGHQCEAILRGLAETENTASLWLGHLARTIDELENP